MRAAGCELMFAGALNTRWRGSEDAAGGEEMMRCCATEIAEQTPHMQQVINIIALVERNTLRGLCSPHIQYQPLSRSFVYRVTCIQEQHMTLHNRDDTVRDTSRPMAPSRSQ
jgi:hypothetical protein